MNLLLEVNNDLIDVTIVANGWMKQTWLLLNQVNKTKEFVFMMICLNPLFHA